MISFIAARKCKSFGENQLAGVHRAGMSMTRSILRPLITLTLFILQWLFIAAPWLPSKISNVDGMNPALAASHCCTEEKIAAAYLTT